MKEDAVAFDDAFCPGPDSSTVLFAILPPVLPTQSCNYANLIRDCVCNVCLTKATTTQLNPKPDAIRCRVVTRNLPRIQLVLSATNTIALSDIHLALLAVRMSVLSHRMIVSSVALRAMQSSVQFSSGRNGLLLSYPPAETRLTAPMPGLTTRLGSCCFASRCLRDGVRFWVSGGLLRLSYRARKDDAYVSTVERCVSLSSSESAWRC
jgi:hypothetical protein